MPSEDLRVEDDPRQEDVALLDTRLYEFNAAASGVHDAAGPGTTPGSSFASGSS